MKISCHNYRHSRTHTHTHTPAQYNSPPPQPAVLNGPLSFLFSSFFEISSWPSPRPSRLQGGHKQQSASVREGGRRESGAKSVPWYGPQNSYCFYVFSAAFKLLLLAHFLAGSARAAAWGWRGGEGGCCSGQGAASEIAKLNKNVTQCLAGCPPRFLFLCLCILFVSFRSVFFFPFFCCLRIRYKRFGVFEFELC